MLPLIILFLVLAGAKLWQSIFPLEWLHENLETMPLQNGDHHYLHPPCST